MLRCGVDVYDRIGFASLIVASVCYFIVLVFVAFAYASVIRRIFKARKRLMKNSSYSSTYGYSPSSSSSSRPNTPEERDGKEVISIGGKSTLFQIKDESVNSIKDTPAIVKPNNQPGINRGIERLCLYLTMFLIQWVPVLSLALALLSQKSQVGDWLYGFAVVFGNIGGLLNLCVYYIVKR